MANNSDIDNLLKSFSTLSSEQVEAEIKMTEQRLKMLRLLRNGLVGGDEAKPRTSKKAVKVPTEPAAA